MGKGLRQEKERERNIRCKERRNWEAKMMIKETKKKLDVGERDVRKKKTDKDVGTKM